MDGAADGSTSSKINWIALSGGIVMAAAALLAAGEAFVRWFPPAELHRYLGNDCPSAGPYRPHPELGVTYASWQQFWSANEERLTQLAPLDSADEQSTWAMFGNSFVQAPGMLADTARQALPRTRVFNLGKNEPLPVRLAQIELLLEHGLRADRILVELMPTDVVELGRQPLSTWGVSDGGALIYAPGLPPAPLDQFVRHSRLALAGWCRAGRQQANPRFKHSRLCREVVPTLQQDLRQLFEHLANICRAHDTPVTVLLIPTWHQLCVGEAWTFQETLAPIFRSVGLDVLDLREPFVSYPRKPELFIPDKHFSDLGNRLLLEQLVVHWSAGVTGP